MKDVTVEITPEQFKRMIDRGDDLFVVDIRNDEEYAACKLEGRRPIPTLHTPYFEIFSEAEGDDLSAAVAAYARREWADRLPKDTVIVVVCAQGGSSDIVAEGLRRLGYRAVNLQGGMVAWGDFYDFQTVVEEDDLQVYQVIRPARGCLSYVVASNGQAIVIDPLRHIDRYVEFARARGLTIVRVLDTHGHADHISGGPALAQELGVPYHVHPYDAIHPLDVLPATIPYDPLWDGQEFPVGKARLRVMHIPGHTLGNVVLYLNDRFLFTGDSIFVESVARPDLGGRGETWAPIHYRSLSRLLTLPDTTIVLPGHFASPAEANGEGRYEATLGSLKASNEGLQKVLEGEEEFLKYMFSSLPTFPKQYVDIKRVNAGLLEPDEDEASELELGRNICALAQAYQGS